MSELTNPALVWLDWPAPDRVKACYSLRRGGFSGPPYQNFNLAEHTGDHPAVVRRNRQLLTAAIDYTSVSWLQQVHGRTVVAARGDEVLAADGSYTRQPDLACCAMTADCLPVFFCDRAGRQVAIAHAGWRGLVRGVLQNTVATFRDPATLLAYLGPAISRRAFEVGDDVRDTFLSLPGARAMGLADAFVSVQRDPATGNNGANNSAKGDKGNGNSDGDIDGCSGGDSGADSRGDSGRANSGGGQGNQWLADIYGLARCLLRQSGVRCIYGGNRCTFAEEGDFFSYRRDGRTGRMASLIWLERR